LNINALAPWFGSKRTLAPRIAELIGEHSVYWEPFCGSMAVLLAKPECRSETVNDLHGDLVNLARCIRDPQDGPALYRRLRRVLFSEALLSDARANMKKIAGRLERAEEYFIQSWMGMSGFAGTGAGEDGKRGIARRFTSNGGDPCVRFRAAVSSIPQWRRRLSRVTILSNDGLEICERIEDKEGTVIYADPPYVDKTEDYVHDFSSPDHERLAKALTRFQETRVVVSYYDHPRLADLYHSPHWTKIAAGVTKGLGKKLGETKTVKAPEVLLANWTIEKDLF